VGGDGAVVEDGEDLGLGEEAGDGGVLVSGDVQGGEAEEGEMGGAGTDAGGEVVGVWRNGMVAVDDDEVAVGEGLGGLAGLGKAVGGEEQSGEQGCDAIHGGLRSGFWCDRHEIGAGSEDCTGVAK
jgi:hypothetical protein